MESFVTENKKGFLQLYWKETNILYYSSNDFSVIMRAYEMAGDFKHDLELRIVERK